jgi:hypothetical protein
MRKRIAGIATACLVVTACVGFPTTASSDPGDSTAALQAMFDGLQPGATLKLDRKVYEHSGIVQIKVPNVRIDGNGATLEATNEVSSSLQIVADGVSVSNLNLTAPIGGQRYSAPEQDKIFIRANGVTLDDITINGSAATGVFLAEAGNFKLNRVTVRDSRADGIHMTWGSNNGQVNNPLIERSGDDGVAVVSYGPGFGYTGPPCRNIVINSPVVTSTTFGQGISALGGENITYNNINVSRSHGAGVFVATIGPPFFTQATTGVRISGGTVTEANVSPDTPMGAIAVYGKYAGNPTSNVNIANLTVSDTPASAQQVIALIVEGGGAVDNIALNNIAVRQQGGLPVFYSNAPRESYTTSGLTLNGAPADVA